MADVSSTLSHTGPDHPTPTGPGEPPPTPPDDRGSLEVHTRAIRHVVERAVIQTPGTVEHTSTMRVLTGSRLPRADIAMIGRSARVTVEVAAVWPCRATQIAAAVRDTVLARAPRMTGVHVRNVDVTVHVIDPDDTDTPGRRVQ